MSTRSSSCCPVYDYPKDLPSKKLPTIKEMMNYFAFVKRNAIYNESNINKGFAYN